MEEMEPMVILISGALIVGGLFGLMAALSGFCLRSAVLEVADRRPPRQILAWLAALATGLVGTQALILTGQVDLSETHFLSAGVAFPAILLGGLMFGVGMMLTRGCGARHLVLATGGNMRSWVVLLVFGLTAYATLRGVLALPRTWLTGATTSHTGQSLPDLLGIDPLFLLAGVLLAIAVSLIVLMRRAGQVTPVIWGVAIGGLIPLGWAVSGIFGFDEFDPVAPGSLTFTAPIANALQYVMTFTGASVSFGIAIVAGTLVGAVLAHAATRRFKPVGFENPGQMGRYLLGAALMGMGGVLAGGCSIGAGLTGVSTLSLGSLLALAAILAGAFATHRLQQKSGTQPQFAPAE